MLTDILFPEACVADARVEYEGRREIIEMIERGPVIDAEQVVTGRANVVDHVCPVAARLPAPVVHVADKEALLIAELLVEAIRFGMEVVEARLATDEVVAALGVARLVRQGVVLQIVFSDPANPVGRNDVAGERVAAYTRAVGARRRRIVDYDVRQQRGKITIAFGLCRHSEVARLRENVFQLLEGKEEKAAIAAIISERPEDLFRKQDGTAYCKPVAVVAQRVAIRLAVVVFVA